jgi:hypothetical protein
MSWLEYSLNKKRCQCRLARRMIVVLRSTVQNICLVCTNCVSSIILRIRHVRNLSTEWLFLSLYTVAYNFLYRRRNKREIHTENGSWVCRSERFIGPDQAAGQRWGLVGLVWFRPVHVLSVIFHHLPVWCTVLCTVPNQTSTHARLLPYAQYQIIHTVFPTTHDAYFIFSVFYFACISEYIQYMIGK